MVLLSCQIWGGGVFNQYIATISASLCFAMMGAAYAWPCPILTKMAAGHTPFQLDVEDTSWMVSLMLLGTFSSPLPTAYGISRFGIKKTSLAVWICPFLSWILIYIATKPVHLYLARFLAGLWNGLGNTVTSLYIGEIASPDLRGSLSTIMSVFWNFGILFVYIFGPSLSYHNLAIACIILSVMFFCTFIFMPESPYFLLKRGDTEEAVKVIQWLRKGEQDEVVRNEIARIDQVIEEQKQNTATLGDIFCDRGNRKGFVLATVYMLMRHATGSGIFLSYSSITLPSLSFGVLDPDTCVIILGLADFISSFIATPLSTKFTRHFLLTISSLGCAVSMAVVAVWFYTVKNENSIKVGDYSDVVFVCLVAYSLMFNIALGPVGTGMRGELFSSNIKGLALSLSSMLFVLLAFFMNKNYLIIRDELGMYVNFVFFAVSSIVSVVITWTYLPDLQNKTLEEIRIILKGKG